MDSIERLQRRFRARWVGVKFYRGKLPCSEVVALPNGRFCEAITEAHIRPALVTRDNLHCPGACHVFGWDDTVQAEMVDRLHQDEGFSLPVAQKLVQDLPTIHGSLTGVGLNVAEIPDVLVSYLQPGQVMSLLRDYQVTFGKDLSVELSSIVSVCGHVALQSFHDQQIAMSFGCAYSRHYGAITRDRVAIGLPFKLARGILGDNE